MKDFAILCFGAVIGSIGYWYKNDVERRRVFSHAVFVFLEIWGVIKILDQRRLVQACTKLEEQFRKHFGSIGPIAKEQQVVFENSIQDFARKMILSRIASCEKSVAAAHVELINLIARYDPILAFQMNGNDEIWKIDGAIKEFLGEIQKLDEGAKISALVNAAEGYFSDSLVGEIESLMRALAWRAGPMVWAKIRWKLWRADENKMTEIDEQLDKFFNKIGSQGNKLQKSRI